jgi:uncharacterized protein
MSKDPISLLEMTLRQLRRIASELGISRYSRMRKDQLLVSIQERQQVAPSTPSPSLESQGQVEAAKFAVGQEDYTGGTLTSVDQGLGDFPGGYGESRIVLMPRDPQWAYAYWDVPNDHRQELRRQGGQRLALRLCDATDVNLGYQSPHSIQEYPCDEMAREWYIPIPLSDRDYVIDIGYRCADGRWLSLARSTPVRIPPTYPSDWINDQFMTVDWETELRGKTLFELGNKHSAAANAGISTPIYDQIFGMAAGTEAMRVAGSLYGSMQHVAASIQHVPTESLSSFVFPSGAGLWALPTASGISDVGFSASAAPIRPRQFWLVADAELIVYGATEPDATVTIGGRPIKLNPDGTFRFQMSFQDGLIDYPILAVAADGEQTRSIHMKFNRETPSRHTNTKEEMVLEWLA